MEQILSAEKNNSLSMNNEQLIAENTELKEQVDVLNKF